MMFCNISERLTLKRNNRTLSLSGKGNGAGLVRESQSHRFADEFVITHAHSFGADTKRDYVKEIAEQCRQL